MRTYWLTHWQQFVLLTALLLYGIFLLQHTSFSVRGYDSTGYANAAYSLRNGTVVEKIPLLKELDLPPDYAPAFLPLTYLALPDTDKMAPLYPVGFPLHLTLFSLLLGWQLGLYLVSPLLATLSVWLFYLISRELGLSRAHASAGACIFAFCPPFVFYALHVMSDVTATFWVLVTIFAALRSQKNMRWSCLAGAAFGVAFLVRPASAMLLLPLAFCLRLHWRSLFFFGLGGSPFALLFCTYNYTVFGHPLYIGYNSIGLQRDFRLTGSLQRFFQYIAWLTFAMSPLVWVGWLCTPWLRHLSWRLRLMLFTWFGAFFALYCFYTWGDGWWYTRFLLPGIPALILTLMMASQSLTEWVAQRFHLTSPHPKLTWGVLCVLLSAMLGYEQYFLHRPAVLNIDESISLDRAACRWAIGLIPKNALVIAMDLSGTWKFYADRTSVRYDLASAEQLQEIIQRGVAQRRPIYAFLLAYEVEPVHKKIPHKWVKVGELGTHSIWTLLAY